MNPSDDHYLSALSLIAHELRSPASIVNGYLRMLQQRDADRLTDDQRRMVKDAGTACGRLLQIIQELGDLATLEESAAQPSANVAVFSLCDEVASAAAGGSIPTFACADSDRSTIVRGDAARLKRAFTALLAATIREHGADQLECVGFVKDFSGSPHAVFMVGRRGVAARRDELVANRMAFDRWRGGMGLSLPIACRIIEAHGGGVWSPASEDLRRASLWHLPIASVGTAA